MSGLYIIHVDMDAFYAAVEQRDDPKLMGKPVIIGGADPTKRGVVSTASYEARKCGVHSAMPLKEAYRRCPRGFYLPVNMKKYKSVSKEIFQLFGEYTPLVETIALDEAFLDVTGSVRLFGPAEKIGQLIKERIKRELDLTASIGISYNKYLAKLASDLNKPDGFLMVNKGNLERIVHPLPVTRLWGVGAKMALKLNAAGHNTIGNIAKADPVDLRRQFGVLGEHISLLSRGIDQRQVIPDHEAKSVGRETTFPRDVSSREILLSVLMQLVEDVCYRLRAEDLRGYCVTVKIRYEDFETHTKQATLDRMTNLEHEVFETARSLFNELHSRRAVRLLGISVSRLSSENEEQLDLFGENRQKHDVLARTSDMLRKKYGRPLITRARGVDKDND
ncbi:DNA polymerase IV [Metallumcola ferriviriculae]|uniref:DNA polymerase IV n=1 Tax=Metallumcola ferriviriculae TaxID=3039180 RepID=A0AAU0UN94_9FIRM|nr:DNA polymerase IV [Desulfitibacteraceae bacterium MK1]